MAELSESRVIEMIAAEPFTKLSTSVLSTSVSLVITLVVTAEFSVVLSVSAIATGPSFVPVTVW